VWVEFFFAYPQHCYVCGQLTPLFYNSTHFFRINDDPRSGTPVKIDGRLKSHIVAIVCSEPPEGFDRWKLELIRERILEKNLLKISVMRVFA